ncbi:MAG: hypothetical protein LBE37_18965 [Sphingobacterium sp.]|nr:hypothetical protein [Sphingobacterium sp.]
MIKKHRFLYKHLAFILLLCAGIDQCLAQLPKGLAKSDSTQVENFNYTLHAPRPNETKGLVVLLPGLFDPPLSIFFESNLPHVLNELNYAVIVPVLSQRGDKFDLSDVTINRLGKLITQYIHASSLRQDIPIILGGFSIGGTRVLKACTVKDSTMSALNISHVFAIDPPLDLNRLLASELKYDEDFLSETLKMEIGELNEEKLASLSVVNINNLAGTTPPHAKGINIRIYNEPALEWQIGIRKRDLLDLNLLDQSVYVNYIKRKHPDLKMELIRSKIEGVRKQTGDRNPHSWNIVDTAELVDWIGK